MRRVSWGISEYPYDYRGPSPISGREIGPLDQFIRVAPDGGPVHLGVFVGFEPRFVRASVHYGYEAPSQLTQLYERVVNIFTSLTAMMSRGGSQSRAPECRAATRHYNFVPT